MKQVRDGIRSGNLEKPRDRRKETREASGSLTGRCRRGETSVLGVLTRIHGLHFCGEEFGLCCREKVELSLESLLGMGGGSLTYEALVGLHRLGWAHLNCD